MNWQIYVGGDIQKYCIYLVNIMVVVFGIFTKMMNISNMLQNTLFGKGPRSGWPMLDQSAEIQAVTILYLTTSRVADGSQEG